MWCSMLAPGGLWLCSCSAVFPSPSLNPEEIIFRCFTFPVLQHGTKYTNTLPSSLVETGMVKNNFRDNWSLYQTVGTAQTSSSLPGADQGRAQSHNAWALGTRFSPDCSASDVCVVMGQVQGPARRSVCQWGAGPGIARQVHRGKAVLRFKLGSKSVAQHTSVWGEDQCSCSMAQARTEGSAWA